MLASGPAEAGDTAYRIPYDLQHPSWEQRLPSALEEVSAFALSPDGQEGWAVNDEAGALYPYVRGRGLLNQPRSFAGPGDYEGLEVVGDEVIVARSDGTLYRVSKDAVTEVKTPLGPENDVEGLALDRARSRLLIACKEKAGPGKAFKERRAVYALSLPSFEWQERPAYTLRLKKLRRFIKKTDVPGLKASHAKDFKPSALAVHPSGQYVLHPIDGRPHACRPRYRRLDRGRGLSPPEGASSARGLGFR